MAKRQSKLDKVRSELALLEHAVPDDLHLPSLKENRLEDFAALFVTVLPLLNSAGQLAFTDPLFRI